MLRTHSTGLAACVMGLTVIGALPSMGAADPVEGERLQTEVWDFALSPGMTTLDFAQFDDQGGTRQLQEVTVSAEGLIEAEVTAENDSEVLPAPDLALNMNGFVQVGLGPVGLVLLFEDTFLTDGSVTESDGVDGSGTDFWDFGMIGTAAADSDSLALPDDLSAFVGGGTVSALVTGTGGFSVSGATDSTIQISNFGTNGTLRVTYGYKAVPGACCLPDGTCVALSVEDCENEGGVYQGPRVMCMDVVCTVEGACCLPNGDCVITEADANPSPLRGVDGTSRECTALGGVYQGNNTTCEKVRCPVPPGACCLIDGECIITDPVSCTNQGGVFRGSDTLCADVDCDEPKAACCLPGGICAARTASLCEQMGGIFLPAEPNCVGVDCPGPSGACCFDDGSCEELSQDDCNAQGGGFQGAETTCVQANCPLPVGACCRPDGNCLVWNEPGCASLGGTFQGPGTTCQTVDCTQPPGACCLPDGSCIEVTQAACNMQGAAFQGVGTLCADASCPMPEGACCLPNGDCEVRTEAACTAGGGSYEGDGSTCADADCPDPVGACCFPDTSCDDMLSAAECAAAGGTYQGDLTPCVVVVCPDPEGACCLPDGSCVTRTQAECIAAGGNYQGDFTMCGNVECPQPKGACCFPDGSCSVRTEELCADLGGDYFGDFTTCVTVECPQPPGACCFLDGTCTFVTQEACGAAGGLWQGAFLECEDADCPQPMGACCFPDGSCSIQTAMECTDLGGTYQGNFTNCTDVDCPDPDGACCLDDGSCVEKTEAECAAAGGDYRGDDTRCADVECEVLGACCFPPPMPFDCNGDMTGLSMIWDGAGDIRVKAWKGSVGSTLLADVDDIAVGDELTVNGYGGSPNDVIWEIFTAGTSTKIGESKFHTSCSDSDMNSADDCGKRQGNGKQNDDGFVNDWLLAGIATTEGVLDCGLGGGEDCLDLTEDDCLAAGGIFQGVGTTCETTTCPEPITCCVDGNKPAILEMMFTAEDCSATDNDQGSSDLCEDSGAIAGTAYIVASEKRSGDAPDGIIWFSGTVSAGNTYDISAPSAGETRLKSNTWVFVYSEQGGALEQTVKIHTSCSQPLVLGDQFGAHVLLSCIGEDDLFTSGGPDLDGDGVLTAGDLVTLLSSWGPCRGCSSDLNHDGVVNDLDLGMILNRIGARR